MRRFRNLELAEDGYQAATVRALQTWPAKGLPRNPEGWLVRVGHNALIDVLRKQNRMVEVSEPENHPDGMAEDIEDALDRAAFQDDHLRLLFLCCHPSLSNGDQIILSMRYVLGLDVPDIAKAFLITPDTLQKRITRARQRAAQIGTPDDGGLTPAARADQISQIRAVLYLMFNKGYAAARGEAHVQPLLTREAIRLTRLLIRVFPEEPETLGLLSLMLGQSARFPARLDADGQLVTLADQDRSLWDSNMIDQAQFFLQKAMLKPRRGTLVVQAAICATHNSARRAEDTNWSEILRLYDVLAELQPTDVIRLNRIVALAEVQGAKPALAALQGLTEPLSNYLPFHAVYAGLSERDGDHNAAIRAYRCAMECDPSIQELTYCKAQIARLEKNLRDQSE